MCTGLFAFRPNQNVPISLPDQVVLIYVSQCRLLVHSECALWLYLFCIFVTSQGRLAASTVGYIVGLQSEEIKQIATEYAEKVIFQLLCKHHPHLQESMLHPGLLSVCQSVND